MKTLLRFAAITVASTALVAGGATAVTAAPGDSATIALQHITLSSYKGASTNSVPVTLTTSRANLTAVKATVNVNGVPVASGVPVFTSGFTYQQSWGAGILTLTNLTDYGNQPVAGGSNPVNVRYGVESRYDNIRIAKRGKKLTFKIKARYIDNRGVAVGIRKASVEVQKGGKWRTLKRLNLKSNGTKTFKKSDRKKRNYRLVIKTTNLYSGGSTGRIKI